MGWRDIGIGGGQSGYLKIAAGEKKMIHVLLKPGEEPHTFSQHYFKDLNRGAVCPGAGCPACESKLKELRPRYQHAIAIYSYTEKETKLWIMSNEVAQQVKTIYEGYKTFDGHDLSVTRIGTGLETKYVVVPFNTRFQSSMVSEVPNPEEVLAPADIETIETMMTGVDPATEFNPEKIEKELEKPVADADPWGGIGQQPQNESAPAYAETADGWDKSITPASPAPVTVVAQAPAVDRTNLMKQVLHKFATHAKLKPKGAKEKFLVQFAPGKKTISQASIVELQAMLKALA